MKTKIKQKLLIFATSFVFMPFLYSQKNPTIFIKPHTKAPENTFSATWKQNQAISTSVTYKILNKEELNNLYLEKTTSNPPKPSNQQIDSMFKKYAQIYNVSEKVLRKIANCESGYNPSATNGIYAGMFQYSSSTWASTRNSMGQNPDPSLRFSAEESIKTSAFKISAGGISAWANCAR